MLISFFNPSNNSFSYFSCKVIIETYNLQSVMLNFKSVGLLISRTKGSATVSPPCAILFLVAFQVKTQFGDHFKINSILY